MAVEKSNREHAFDVELATFIGPMKAILAKNVKYWVDENARKKAAHYFKDGFYWTLESLNSLHKKYPYMKRSNIGRWVNEMEADMWVIVLKAERETNYYRPGPTFELWENDGDVLAALSHFETQRKTQSLSQNETGLSQNETGLSQNETETCPKMRHYNIDCYSDLNIEKNIEKGVFGFSNVEAKNETQKNSAAPQNPKPSPVEAPVDQAPPNGAAPPPKNQDSAFQDRPFAVTMCAQEETPTGPVLVRLHGETVRVPVQEPKTRKAKPRAAEITPEQIAQHLQPKEQAFFAQVLNNGSWADYMEYKNKDLKFHYKSSKSAAQAVRDMISVTFGNADIAQDVVNQTRGKGWIGLQPLKQINNNTNGNYGQHNRQPQPQPDLSNFHAGIGSFFGRNQGS